MDIKPLELQMEKKVRNNGLWYGVPPWIIVGSMIILLPIFIWWTIDNIQRQKEITTLLLLEKGAALIRSFEAGTRTGMLGMLGTRWSSIQLQRLLSETAKLPDIKYIMVIDADGTITADSDPSMIGTTYKDFSKVKENAFSKDLQSRQVMDTQGRSAFEVFRRFSPRHVYSRLRQGNRIIDNELLNSIQPQSTQQDEVQAIFVGMDTSQIEEARKENTRHTVVMAAVLLLIGLGGISSLFLVQAYRTTRSSLKKIKAFSDNLVENMPIGLVALDSEKKIASLNNAAELMLFKSGAPLTGDPAGVVLPPEVFNLVEEINVSKPGIIEREINYHSPDGKRLILEVSISILMGEDGSFHGYIILFRDLTQIRSLEREIERSRRLASIGGLAAGVAHEIRNPLSSIKGFATYFSERYSHIPEDKKTAEIMIQEVERLNRVIGQLLEFAKPVNIQKRPISIRTLIEHSKKIVEKDAERRKIKIDINGVPNDLAPVPLDSDRMNQVFLNLYLNAIDAMPDGGALTTKAAVEEDSNMLSISITDTGRGIEKKDLAHVFDPYFTSKQSGTGLGLSIVHRIIESHNGQVSIESEPGKGTRVMILLPLT
jgi:two-component system, NtrC family, sensor histidine kinase HydH